MKKVNVLFLGASKRVSLLERFVKASSSLGIELRMFSCESSSDFCPISHLATILEGPSFISQKFVDYLPAVVSENAINLIIPNMDSAAVALSQLKCVLDGDHVTCVVSSYELCAAMYDKAKASRFFLRHGIPTPINTKGTFPKIVKPLCGFGSRGVRIIHSQSELFANPDFLDQSKYIVQDFIRGKETTLDFYVSHTMGLVGYVLRDRIEVSDGEVMACNTRPPDAVEKAFIDKLVAMTGWLGCITAQYIRNDSGIYLIEINPRFGGGATCSIEAGLDMPYFLLSDFLRRPYSVPKEIKQLKMVRARRDFFYEI